jgi:ferritin
MLSKKLLNALNDQINHELASAYIYLSMSAYFESENLPGFAAWMRRQATEEAGHAMKIFDFINDRDGRVSLKAVAQPPADFRSPLAAFEQSLAQERKISALIHKLYAMAAREDDYATQAMLQWFVTEQVEEEKSVKLIVEQLKRIGPSTSAIFFLDRHVGKDAQEKDG